MGGGLSPRLSPQSQRDPDTELPAQLQKNWKIHPENSGGAGKWWPLGWLTTVVVLQKD